MKRFFMSALGGVLALGLVSLNPATSEAGSPDHSLDVSGFVDVAYIDAQNHGSSFVVEQIELNFDAVVNDKVGATLDLNMFPAVTDIDDDNTDDLTSNDIVEQAYVTYKASDTVDVTFGKFNAPIGFESLDPVDMYQFSHALVFNYGIPTNLEGLMVSSNFGMADLSVYAANGWDNNHDSNNAKTIGGRLGVSPTAGVNVGLSYISGTGDSSTGGADDKTTVMDVDATVNLPDLEALTVGLEYNSGKTDVPAAEQKWTAYMVMANYAFNERYGVTLRYEKFDDKDGARLPKAPTLGTPFDTTSATIAFLAELGHGAEFILEWRSDKASANVYNSNTEDKENTLAAEVVVAFGS